MKRALSFLIFTSLIVMMNCSKGKKNGAELMNDGGLYLYAGHYDKAIECFEEAINYFKKVENDPKMVGAAYANLGTVYCEKKDYNRALECCEEALKYGGDTVCAAAFLTMGAAYGEQGYFDKEIEYYHKVINIDPNDETAYYNMGRAYFSKGDYDKAIEFYNKAIEIDPDYMDAYYFLSEVHHRKGEKEKEIEYLKRAAQLGHKKAQEKLSDYGLSW